MINWATHHHDWRYAGGDMWICDCGKFLLESDVDSLLKLTMPKIHSQPDRGENE